MSKFKLVFAAAVTALVSFTLQAGDWADNWSFGGGKLTEVDGSGDPVSGGWVFNASGAADNISLGTVDTPGSCTKLDFSATGVKQIAGSAWVGNTTITALKFPSTFTTVNHWACQNMTSLGSVDFGENSALTYLGCDCFSGCSSLTTVTPLLPEGVSTVWSSFRGCPLTGNLRLGYGAGSNFEVQGSSFAGQQFTSVDLGPYVTRIGHWAFNGGSINTTLTTVTMTDNVTYMGQSVFENCVNLTTVTPLLPKGLTSLDPNTFKNNPLTGTMEVATGANSYSMSANFAQNTQIDTLVLGTNFTGVFTGHWAFGGDSHLKYIKCKSYNVLSFSGVAGTFDAIAKYQVLLEVPQKSGDWQTVLADTEQVTPWAQVDDDAKTAFHTNFPTEKDPVGLIIAEWGGPLWGWTRQFVDLPVDHDRCG